MGQLTDRRAEFERYLWDHAADEFQAQFDERRELDTAELKFLSDVYRWVTGADDEEALNKIKKAFSADEDRVALLLQLCGLTRNKILTDLRASGAAKGLTIPSSYRKIAATDGWSLAGPYLLKRLRAVMGQLDAGAPTLAQLFEAVNQATWPGYIRQQRAKLSGHEAEYRLAVLYASLQVPFVPKEKAENPLCRDAQIGDQSFDLVSPDLEHPRLLVMATVHTANIGQYGESKTSGDIARARAWVDNNFKSDPPTLIAFADGVGFRSNRAGLDGVLMTADEFCQFKSLWKAVVIAAKRLEFPLRVALPAETRQQFGSFIDRWNARDVVCTLESLNSTVGWLEAGDGMVTRTD